MEKIEQFFKNRASFNKTEIHFSSLSPILRFTTKNIYNSEDYSLDFLKEKIKPLCYYLYSFLKEPRIIKIRIWLEHLDDNGRQWYGNITKFHFLDLDKEFLQEIEAYLDGEKTYFIHKIPTKPFRITVEKLCSSMEEEDIEEDIEEDSEEEKETINTDKSFKSDECVICLTNLPSVLFCNCGHIAICVECDKVKSLNV